MPRALFLLLVLTFGSCTHLCSYQYIAEPTTPISEEETLAVVESFEKYLQFGGYEQLSHRSDEDFNQTMFLLGRSGGDGFLYMNPLRSDMLALRYEGGNTFFVSMLRAHSPGSCIPDESRESFESYTKTFIKAASGVEVELRLIE